VSAGGLKKLPPPVDPQWQEACQVLDEIFHLHIDARAGRLSALKFRAFFSFRGFSRPDAPPPETSRWATLLLMCA
jgi:hypothetical protein